MARFKVTLEYAGTRYSGWQIQKNARTVQGELTRVVQEVTGQRQFEIYGSGRTDAGVHALELVRHRFHARHDAVARSYLYQISKRRTAFAKNFVWWVREDLDLARMRATAERFSGMKDFRSFTDDSADEKSTLVAIERIDIAEDGDLIL